MRHLHLIKESIPNRKEMAAIYTMFVFNGHSAIARGDQEKFNILQEELGNTIVEMANLHPNHPRLEVIRKTPFFKMYI